MSVLSHSPELGACQTDAVNRSDAGSSRARQRAWYLAVRGVLERAAATVLLVPALPLMLLAGVLVKLTSRGPVFYSQARLGRLGRPYQIYKIRTMIHNCESKTGPQWSVKGDPRITPAGRFLRRTHLDELPQLWNVLRGEMSLIGPRPERPEFVLHLERAIPRYRERLLVRPGVTGLAQIQLPPDTDLASVRRKLAYDLHYVQGVSLWLDMRILLGTGLKVLGVSFDVIRRVCRLPGPKGTDDGESGPSPTAATGVVIRPLPA